MKSRKVVVYLIGLGIMLGVISAVYAQNTINPGDTIQGELTGNTAQYSFTAKAGETVIISLNSGAFDPLIELHNANGVEVGRDDDGGGFPNARLAFTAVEDGTYTIVVTSFSGDATGAYTLNLETQTATTITYGALVETKMAGTAPLYFSFNGTEGDVLDIYAVSAANEDTRLVLRGPDNTEIISDDDGGGDLNPYIRRVVLPSTGVYQVELSPFSDTALSGDIILTVEQTQLLTLDANPQTVALGGDNPESEVFHFEATGGTTYRLVVVLDSTEASDVSIFISQEDSFTNPSFNAYNISRVTMEFAPELTGPVVVEVSSFSFAEDGVTITISLEPVE